MNEKLYDCSDVCQGNNPNICRAAFALAASCKIERIIPEDSVQRTLSAGLNDAGCALEPAAVANRLTFFVSEMTPRRRIPIDRAI